MVNLEELIGRIGIYTAYDDVVFGERYAGKRATIVDGEYYEDGGGEFQIQFENGDCIMVQMYEFELI